MADLLRRLRREDSARRDDAGVVAQELLSRLSVEPFLDDPEGATVAFREALEKRLVGNIQEAFVAGKEAAYETIAAVPPKTVPILPGRVLNKTEREVLLDMLGIPRMEFAGQNRIFGIGLRTAVKAQNAAGRTREQILQTLQTDWERRGIRTSQWQRAVADFAKALIGQADLAGQVCGYAGMGKTGGDTS